MNVTVGFSCKPERQKNKLEAMIISVTISEGLERRVVDKAMTKYSETLKSKYLFEKVRVLKPSLSLYEFVCQPNRQMSSPPSEETFINYLSSIGFISISSIEEFETMEVNRLATIYSRYSAEIMTEQSFKKYVSRKSYMNKKEFSRLYQKLLITRDTIEQLSYQANEVVDWSGKIADCDIILEHIRDFYWDMGLFVMIDTKVKKELRNYSDFYDNMKESHLLTES